MSRIEIDIDGKGGKTNGLVYDGKGKARLVRELGEGLSDPNSVARRIKWIAAKPIKAGGGALK